TAKWWEFASRRLRRPECDRKVLASAHLRQRRAGRPAVSRGDPLGGGPDPPGSFAGGRGVAGPGGGTDAGEAGADRRGARGAGRQPEPIRVLIVDDHALFRRGLEMVLAEEPDIEVVGEASDGAEAVEKAGQALPDVVLMDIRMPRSSGIEACRAMKELSPSA